MCAVNPNPAVLAAHTSPTGPGEEFRHLLPSAVLLLLFHLPLAEATAIFPSPLCPCVTCIVILHIRRHGAFPGAFGLSVLAPATICSPKFLRPISQISSSPYAEQLCFPPSPSPIFHPFCSQLVPLPLTLHPLHCSQT